MAEETIIDKDLTVNECIRLYPSTIGVFTKFKIDSCCGGAVSIKEAALRDGADLDSLMREINAAT